MDMPDRILTPLVTELVQVAAVAAAFIEDLTYGRTGTDYTAPVLVLVAEERDRQDTKWGRQHHTPMEWLAVLGEEYGEACRAAVETHRWPPRQQRVFDSE